MFTPSRRRIPRSELAAKRFISRRRRALRKFDLTLIKSLSRRACAPRDGSRLRDNIIVKWQTDSERYGFAGSARRGERSVPEYATNPPPPPQQRRHSIVESATDTTFYSVNIRSTLPRLRNCPNSNIEGDPPPPPLARLPRVPLGILEIPSERNGQGAGEGEGAREGPLGGLIKMSNIK